jgi:trehalose 6-phosphate synthase/phosphatase
MIMHRVGISPERRVLIAANRLPVTATLRAGTVEFTRSAGGVASGLERVASRLPTVWFGWHGLPAEAAGQSSQLSRFGKGLIEIPLTRNEIERFYRGYANGVLWPALHGWSEESCGDPIDWKIYQQVNSRYANAILDDLDGSDRVWVHDYHLLLVPQLLRAQAADASIAFFLHTPFPTPEEFLAIPQAPQLIDGMLGADTIGFHTRDYVRNFLETAAHFGYSIDDNTVRIGSRAVQVKHAPMGIDCVEFTRLASDPQVLSELARLQSTKAPVMMLGVDRLDYTKGIPNRLLAFEHLLETHAELHKRVSLVQIAVPTREEIAAYQDLRHVVEQLVERINQRFGSASWLPVDCLFASVDLPTLVALYRAADVMLVTPQRDGLNLVAKEFVASRVDGSGVLVLSQFAGVANELTAALQVDPNRVARLSAGLYAALQMPIPERRRRMRQMRRAVLCNSIFHWANECIGGLELQAEHAGVSSEQ